MLSNDIVGEVATSPTVYHNFFLCLSLRSLFFLLCLAIFFLFLFLPQGMFTSLDNFLIYNLIQRIFYYALRPILFKLGDKGSND